MFTGIIEEIGTIKSIKKLDQGALINIGCNKVLSDLAIGDSVAIDGACQTVIKFDNSSFFIEASQETLNLTTLSTCKAEQKVNLERAMLANSRFGGHIVSGHIDTIGTFVKKVKQGIADIYYFEATDTASKYMVYKGSICINGISLTIASLTKNTFTVSVIPTTTQSSTLQYLNSGDKVNLESDIIAKYVEKFVSTSSNNEKINVKYLEEHGFM